ncbi:uncharacterized protein LOC133923077 [Phragmites australis]|uniref:uncharacterized protein LOC133923077 n=1 Tax=Phragmites australis TaxID=29695 RepID=UPI002D7969D4|nr:uncharacterized protein LOC133923077 [Phragmites australis]
MTGDKEKFRELDEGVIGKVKFGDGSTVQIMGLGSIVFSCKNGDQWLLQEVYYIPRLCSNITSLGQLTEVRQKVIIDAEHLRVYDNSPTQLLMKVRRTPNHLYKIELHQAMPMLIGKGMAVGVPPITHPNELCQRCLLAKQASYFMLIVDDYSRWMWVFMIKSKDQACSMFRKFKLQAENTSRQRIKTLRTDRGGKFLSVEFTQLCEEAEIKRHLTASYTPQQNGMVEQRNRTVMAMARSLLKSMNVTGRFWG